MTQISRYPLDKTIEHDMFVVFNQALARLHSESDISDFLSDLLSPTEKIMLGKRLAIALLLEKGYDQRTIHKMLKVSTTTVNSVNFSLKQKGKGYSTVINMLRKEEQFIHLLESIDKTLEELLSAKAWHRKIHG